MANVVVREVEMMQTAASIKRASFTAEQQDGPGEEWRHNPTPAVALVDTADPAWRTLVAEDGIEAVRTARRMTFQDP